MGNLLGAPVTEKETVTGETVDGISFAVSSMQGWRVHMEDAHIAELGLYASERVVDSEGKVAYKKIDLPGHSLFAVFDGHGGTYAAAYAGRNLCRVLSRQPKFVEYANFERERPVTETLITTSTQRAYYIRGGLVLLQEALCDAFVELDKEIACALKGMKVEDADTPYQELKDSHLRSSRNGPGSDTMDGITISESQASPTDAALQLLEEEGDSGTTACVVVLTPEWIVCANAGDSRAVLSKFGNKVVPLSYDHKPADEHEERRIRTAGGYVAGGRVDGDLAVSRGLGDYRFKNMDVVMAATSIDDHAGNNGDANQRATIMRPSDQKVSPVPDIIVQNRNNAQDEFIIIACDGIWDVQANHEAVKSVAELFQEGEANIGLICEEICDVCLSLGSKDNMTTLIIKFPGQKVGEGGGVVVRRQRRDVDQQDKDGRGPGTS